MSSIRRRLLANLRTTDPDIPKNSPHRAQSSSELCGHGAVEASPFAAGRWSLAAFGRLPLPKIQTHRLSNWSCSLSGVETGPSALQSQERPSISATSLLGTTEAIEHRYCLRAAHIPNPVRPRSFMSKLIWSRSMLVALQCTGTAAQSPLTR